MERFWSPRPEVLAYVEGLIQPGWRVLEIGPGSLPFSKATHFVNRAGERTSPTAPTSIVDIVSEPLPFPDKSFDFIYCRHVVEDLVYPDLVLSEMNRVGKAGFIETPSPLVELTRGIDGCPQSEKYRGYIHHKWLVWNDGLALHLVEKAPILEHLPLARLDPEPLPLRNGLFWNQYFLWEGTLRFVRHQHDVDFKLQWDYEALVQDAAFECIKQTGRFYQPSLLARKVPQ